MPDALRAAYMEEADALLEYYYFDDSYEGYYQSFPRASLEAMARMVRGRKQGINYAEIDTILYYLLDNPPTSQYTHQSEHAHPHATSHVVGKGLREMLQGAAVVVVGSVVPWYEVLALENGANFTFTLEYNRVQYDHPQMFADIPSSYWANRRHLNSQNDTHTHAGASAHIDADGNNEDGKGEGTSRRGAHMRYISGEMQFDVGFSISSIEHAGLGRLFSYVCMYTCVHTCTYEYVFI